MSKKRKISIKKYLFLALLAIIAYLIYAFIWYQKNTSYKPELSKVTDQEIIEDLQRLVDQKNQK
ncbi:hypothetical protein HYU92_02140 [Candidatus Curtissbacteria bacterium]|nr:hypothetical protein [Candidatus Curtissbacteria bacterium]